MIVEVVDPLTLEDVHGVERCARAAARWNRVRSWDNPLHCFVQDWDRFCTLMGDRQGTSTPKGTVGYHWRRHGVDGIWVKVNYGSRVEQLKTAGHEWAHALMSFGTGHAVSWRRTYVLTRVAMMSLFPETTYSDEGIRRLVQRYTQPRNTGWTYTRDDDIVAWDAESWSEYLLRCENEVTRLCTAVDQFRTWLETAEW